jgi:hypothetical protein
MITIFQIHPSDKLTVPPSAAIKEGTEAQEAKKKGN